MTRAHTTTNHERIRKWVESRGGHPASVAATGDHGLLRIDFDPSEESLKETDWETFFDTFEHKQLAFLYQDKTADGKPSRFNKFIDRTSTEASDLSEDENTEDDAELDASASGSKASKPSKSSTKASSKNKAGGTKTAPKAKDEDEDEDEEEADEELDDDDFDDEDEED